MSDNFEVKNIYLNNKYKYYLRLTRKWIPGPQKETMWWAKINDNEEIIISESELRRYYHIVHEQNKPFIPEENNRFEKIGD